MQSIRAILGHERSLREVAQAIYFGAHSLPAAAYGALHVTCADESELECSEALQHGFLQYVLPALKFSRRAPFRLANLGARYEWAAVRLAEAHFAAPEDGGGFKCVVVKINAHVAFEETPGGEPPVVGDRSFRFGRWRRYGRESTACGAVLAALSGDTGPHVAELVEAFGSEGEDRLAVLNDPTRVPPQLAPLYAALVSARLQARKAVLDIQDHTAAAPTLWFVLPCVTVNRHERDTEIVAGMYTLDRRDGAARDSYVGLGDRPQHYRASIDHRRFVIADDELATERPARDHRAAVRAIVRERVSNPPADERLARVRTDVGNNKHRGHGHARSLLRIALPVLAEVAPVPAATLAFADGAVGIHHAFKIHRLARSMEGTDEARRILEEVESRIDRLEPDRAEALLELLVADYRR